MSLFLPKLTCKKDIDDVIKGVAEKVVVLRFGRDEDSVCLQLDEIVSRTNIAINQTTAWFYLVLCFANLLCLFSSSCLKLPMT